MIDTLPKAPWEDSGLDENGLPYAPWESRITQQPQEQPKPEPSGMMRRYVADPLVSLGKGLVSLNDASIGLADLATGGYAGKKLEEATGYNSGKVQEFLDTKYSPERQQINQGMANEEGFLNKLAYATKNPSTIAHSVIQSAPSMVGAGYIGRALIGAAPTAMAAAGSGAGKLLGIGAEYATPLVAGSIGEGLIQTAGSAEGIRQDSPDKTLSAKGYAGSLASGVFDALITLGSGKVAQYLGVADKDVLLAGGKTAKPVMVSRETITKDGVKTITEKEKGLFRKTIEGAINEGVLQELPQGAQETILQNIASDKPWDEGVSDSAAMGLLSGIAMGGGASVYDAAANRKTGTSINQEKPITVDPRTIAADGLAPQADDIVVDNGNNIAPTLPPAVPHIVSSAPATDDVPFPHVPPVISDPNADVDAALTNMAMGKGHDISTDTLIASLTGDSLTLPGYDNSGIEPYVPVGSPSTAEESANVFSQNEPVKPSVESAATIADGIRTGDVSTPYDPAIDDGTGIVADVKPKELESLSLDSLSKAKGIFESRNRPDVVKMIDDQIADKKNAVPRELRTVFGVMRGDISAGGIEGMKDVGEGGSDKLQVVGKISTHQPWFKKMNKSVEEHFKELGIKDRTTGSDEFETILKKVEAGYTGWNGRRELMTLNREFKAAKDSFKKGKITKEEFEAAKAKHAEETNRDFGLKNLTADQKVVWDEMLKAADEYSGQHPDAVAASDEDYFKIRGMSANHQQPINVESLQFGDKLMIKGEMFEVKGMDDEGNVVLQDGKPVVVPAFGNVEGVDAVEYVDNPKEPVQFKNPNGEKLDTLEDAVQDNNDASVPVDVVPGSVPVAAKIQAITPIPNETLIGMSPSDIDSAIAEHGKMRPPKSKALFGDVGPSQKQLNNHVQSMKDWKAELNRLNRFKEKAVETIKESEVIDNGEKGKTETETLLGDGTPGVTPVSDSDAGDNFRLVGDDGYHILDSLLPAYSTRGKATSGKSEYETPKMSKAQAEEFKTKAEQLGFIRNGFNIHPLGMISESYNIPKIKASVPVAPVDTKETKPVEQSTPKSLRKKGFKLTRILGGATDIEHEKPFTVNGKNAKIKPSGDKYIFSINGQYEDNVDLKRDIKVVSEIKKENKQPSALDAIVKTIVYDNPSTRSIHRNYIKNIDDKTLEALHSSGHINWKKSSGNVNNIVLTQKTINEYQLDEKEHEASFNEFSKDIKNKSIEDLESILTAYKESKAAGHTIGEGIKDFLPKYISTIEKEIGSRKNKQPSESTPITPPNAQGDAQSTEGIQGQGIKTFDPMGMLTGEVKPEKNEEPYKPSNEYVGAKEETVLKLNEIRNSISKEISDRTSTDTTIPIGSKIGFKERQEVKRNRNNLKAEQASLSNVDDAIRRIDAGENIDKVLSDHRQTLDYYIDNFGDWNKEISNKLREEQGSEGTQGQGSNTDKTVPSTKAPTAEESVKALTDIVNKNKERSSAKSGVSGIYDFLAKPRDIGIPLKEVRQQFPDISKADFDAEILRLNKDGKIQVTYSALPQASLTEQKKADRIEVKDRNGETKYIEDVYPVRADRDQAVFVSENKNQETDNAIIDSILSQPYAEKWKITQKDNGSFRVDVGGGKYFDLKLQDNIDLSKGSVEQAYGKSADEMRDEKGELLVVAGSYKRGEQTIRIRRDTSNNVVFDHELYHFIEHAGVMSEQEISILKDKIKQMVKEGKWETLNKKDIGGSEDRAQFIAEALDGRRSVTGLWNKIVQRIKDFMDWVNDVTGYRSAESIVRDVESGKVLGREGGVSEAEAQKEQLVFAGKNAAGYDQAEKEGRVFLGKFDDKSRFYVDDSGAKLKNWEVLASEKHMSADKDNRIKLPDILEHDEFFKNYPDAKDIKFVKKDMLPGSLGWFSPYENTIAVNSDLKGSEAILTILHEIQHWVQGKENFATGGNTNLINTINNIDKVKSYISKNKPELSKEIENLEKEIPVILEKEGKKAFLISQLSEIKDRAKALSDKAKGIMDGLAEKYNEAISYDNRAGGIFYDFSTDYTKTEEYQKLSKRVDDALDDWSKGKITKYEYDNIKNDARSKRVDLQNKYDNIRRIVKDASGKIFKLDEIVNSSEYSHHDSLSKFYKEIKNIKSVVESISRKYDDGVMYYAYKIIGGEIESRDVSDIYENRKMIESFDKKPSEKLVDIAKRVISSRKDFDDNLDFDEYFKSKEKFSEELKKEYEYFSEYYNKNFYSFLGDKGKDIYAGMANNIVLGKPILTIEKLSELESHQGIDKEDAIVTFEKDSNGNLYASYGDKQTGNRGAFDPNDKGIDYAFAKKATSSNQQDIDSAYESVPEQTRKEHEQAFNDARNDRSVFIKSKDSSIFDKWLLSPMYKKSQQMQKAYESAVNWTEDKVKNFDRLIKDYRTGIRLNKSLEDLQKTSPKEYETIRDKWLLFMDKERVGYSVKEDDKSKGQFILTPPANMTSRRKEETFKSYQEAWAAAKEYELQDYLATVPGATQAGADAIRDFRKINDNILEMRMEALSRIMEECDAQGVPYPQIVTRDEVGGEIKTNLKAAVANMNEIRGYYFPRLRQQGRMQMKAVLENSKGEITDRVMKFYDVGFLNDKGGTLKNLANKAIGLAGKAGIETMESKRRELEAKGYKVSIKEAERLPESIFQDAAGKQLSLEKMMDKAIQNLDADVPKTLKDIGIHGKWDKAKKDYTVYDLTILKGVTADVLVEMGGVYEYKAKKGIGGMGTYVFKDAPKDIEKLIKDRIFKLNNINPDIGLSLATSLLEGMADVIRSHGSRANMTKRSTDYWGGFETDPAIAVTRSAQSVAGGEAKRTLAINLLNVANGTIESMDEFKEKNPTLSKKALTAAYQAQRNELKIDPASQSELWSDFKSYMNDLLRNEETWDRMVGQLTGLAVAKYLMFRVAAPVANMTAMVTTAPASMNAHAGIEFKNIPGLIGRAGAAYTAYLARTNEHSSKLFKNPDDMSKINPRMVEIFDAIKDRGWDKAQYNYEAVAVLRSKVGRGWDRVIDWGMAMFGITEQINRATTIAATYNGIMDKAGRSNDPLDQDVLKQAHAVSDFAHGVYGKADLMYVARGADPMSNIMRSNLTFKKFAINFMMNLYDIGVRQQNLRAAAYMVLSPMIVGGVGASIASGPAMFIANSILSAMGMGSDDPEEELYKFIETNFGGGTERAARYGIPGLAGINIKGSVDVGMGSIPTSFVDIFGAPGAVVKDVYEGIQETAQGNVWKGLEGMSPNAIGSVSKAVRESTEGATKKSNAPIFYGNEQLKLSFHEAVARALSFSPAEMSEKKEKMWSESNIKKKYSEDKDEILDKYRRFYLLPIDKRDKEKLYSLQTEVSEFNKRLLDRKINRAMVSPITYNSIKTSIRRAFKPNKFERYRASTMDKGDDTDTE